MEEKEKSIRCFLVSLIEVIRTTSWVGRCSGGEQFERDSIKGSFSFHLPSTTSTVP